MQEITILKKNIPITKFFESPSWKNVFLFWEPYNTELFRRCPALWNYLVLFWKFLFCFYPRGFEPGTQFQGIQEYGFIKERPSKKYVEPLMLGTAPPPHNFDYFQGAISNESLSIASPRFDFVFIRGKISKLYIHLYKQLWY